METKIEENTIQSNVFDSKSSTLVGMQARKFASITKPVVQESVTSVKKIESPQIIRYKNRNSNETQEIKLDRNFNDSQEYMVILGDKSLKEKGTLVMHSPTSALSMSNLEQRYKEKSSSRKDLYSPKSKCNTLENVLS